MKTTNGTSGNWKHQFKKLGLSLFKVQKKFLPFISLFVFLPVVLTIGKLLNVSYPPSFEKHLTSWFSFYLLLFIYLYKKNSSASEEDMRRYIFHILILLSILSVASSGFVISHIQNPILYLLGMIFGALSSLLSETFILFGYLSILYSGFEKAKLVKLAFVSLLISVLSSLYSVYAERLSSIFSLSLPISVLTGIFLVHAFYRIIRPFSTPKTFFLVFGGIIFTLEFLEGIILDYSSGYMVVGYDFVGLFVLNFQFFIMYGLWGLYLHYMDSPKDHVNP